MLQLFNENILSLFCELFFRNNFVCFSFCCKRCSSACEYGNVDICRRRNKDEDEIKLLKPGLILLELPNLHLSVAIRNRSVMNFALCEMLESFETTQSSRL